MTVAVSRDEGRTSEEGHPIMDGHSYQPLWTVFMVEERALLPMTSRALNMKAAHCLVEYSLGRHMGFLCSIAHYHNLSSLKQHLVLTPQLLWLRMVKHSSSGSSAQATAKVSRGCIFIWTLDRGTSLPGSCGGCQHSLSCSYRDDSSGSLWLLARGCPQQVL